MEGNRQKVTTVDILRTDRESGAKLLEREYKARLCAVARRLGVDETEAEALAYRTIDEAVRAIDGYTEQSAFFPWLCKILVNSHAKDVRRKSNATVDFVAELPEPTAPEVQADGSQTIVEAVDAGLLRDAIDSLPADMREAVVLRYFLDLPIARMAKILSLPIGTVKSRLYYARVALAQRLDGRLVKRVVTSVLVALLVGFGAWAAVRLWPTTYYWKPGKTLSRYDDRANWSTEGLGGALAAELPGADANLFGSGDYAFDICGRETLLGWETPDDWNNHYLTVANGTLRFSGAVSTHTGELTIERGGTVTLLEGSSYTPALFSAGKWTTRVKAGGAFNLLGTFKGYSYRILVEAGGTATINPRYWGGDSGSEQSDNSVENSGVLNLPAGLTWQRGGSSAETYSVHLRQKAGELNLGGPIAKAAEIRNRMTLGVELLGGTVNASGQVSFAADTATLADGVSFTTAKGTVLDLSTFAVADGANLRFSGEGEARLPAGSYGEIVVEGGVLKFAGEAAVEKLTTLKGATVVPYGCEQVPAGVVRLGGGERLTVVEDMVLTNGLVFAAGADGALPSLVVEKGATLLVPGDTRFGDVALTVRGTLAAFDAGDLVLGYAAVGRRAPFALDVDGGTISNAFGNIDFFCPNFGGTVAAAGAVTLSDATLWTDARHAFNFGVNNPETEAVTVELARTTLAYAGGTYYVAGGVTLRFTDGARLYRADNALEKADLIVRGRARLVFCEGTRLDYGASANGFGSVGNGGISFIPSEDGFASLTLDRATFWYHHPNSIRGKNRATLCATNAVYELGPMTWNYTMPFSGFKAVEGTVTAPNGGPTAGGGAEERKASGK